MIFFFCLIDSILSFLPDLNFLDDIFSNVNCFMEFFFGYLKYIFAGILIAIGLFTIFSLRGKYFLEWLRYFQKQYWWNRR